MSAPGKESARARPKVWPVSSLYPFLARLGKQDKEAAGFLDPKGKGEREREKEVKAKRGGGRPEAA